MNKKTVFIISGAMVLINIFSYFFLPEKVAIHWNLQGKADGFLNKLSGNFLFLGLFLFFAFIFWLIPKIDPLKNNIKKFIKEYNLIFLYLLVFLFLVYLYFLTWNLGLKFDIRVFISIIFGLLYIAIGKSLKNVKRNWFIGIRTPWTLSNNLVWQKTHHQGARIFKIIGFLSFLGMFFKELTVYLVIFLPILAGVYLVFYSYFLYKKQLK